jgi:D-3-phosphoglycerate dehydrogenase
MPSKIAVTTSSFAKFDQRPLQLIKDKGCAYICNSLGRTLTKDEVLDLLADCDGVIAGTEIYTSDILKELPRLKVISRCGTGVDNIDLSEAQRQGIKIYNTPDGPTRAVAELVIGLAMNLLREVTWMDRDLRQGVWAKRMGQLILEKNFGLVGFGRIGQAVAGLAMAVGAKVLFYDSQIADVQNIKAERVEFRELLSRSDIVSVHVPYTDQTKFLFGTRAFEQMRDRSFLINCSRSGIVDERALCNALTNGKLAGAAVDVFEREPYDGPLKALDNVILTPHVGSYARETRIYMEIQAVENLLNELNMRENKEENLK